MYPFPFIPLLTGKIFILLNLIFFKKYLLYLINEGFSIFFFKNNLIED